MDQRQKYCLRGVIGDAVRTLCYFASLVGNAHEAGWNGNHTVYSVLAGTFAVGFPSLRLYLLYCSGAETNEDRDTSHAWNAWFDLGLDGLYFISVVGFFGAGPIRLHLAAWGVLASLFALDAFRWYSLPRFVRRNVYTPLGTNESAAWQDVPREVKQLVGLCAAAAVCQLGTSVLLVLTLAPPVSGWLLTAVGMATLLSSGLSLLLAWLIMRREDRVLKDVQWPPLLYMIFCLGLIAALPQVIPQGLMASAAALNLVFAILLTRIRKNDSVASFCETDSKDNASNEEDPDG